MGKGGYGGGEKRRGCFRFVGTYVLFLSRQFEELVHVLVRLEPRFWWRSVLFSKRKILFGFFFGLRTGPCRPVFFSSISILNRWTLGFTGVHTNGKELCDHIFLHAGL